MDINRPCDLYATQQVAVAMERVAAVRRSQHDEAHVVRWDVRRVGTCGAAGVALSHHIIHTHLVSGGQSELSPAYAQARRLAAAVKQQHGQPAPREWPRQHLRDDANSGGIGRVKGRELGH
eukprot:scaffold806_cov115-Isochrysis_galbana.AAC.1